MSFLSRELRCSPHFFEMRTLPSVRTVIQTSLDDLSVADVTLAVRTFFRNKVDLSVEEVWDLKVRVDHLSDKCVEKRNFPTFFEKYYFALIHDGATEWCHRTR